MKYILGIDTSAYTTSIALVDSKTGRILADERKVLEVKEGQKGLRQQEAVFQHLKICRNFTPILKRTYPRSAMFPSAQDREIPKALTCLYLLQAGISEGLFPTP